MLYNSYSKVAQNEFGVCHADELFVQFRAKVFGDKNELAKTDKDTEVTKKMMQMWTNFAYGVEPHPDWKPISQDYHKWARIGTKIDPFLHILTYLDTS